MKLQPSEREEDVSVGKKQRKQLDLGREKLTGQLQKTCEECKSLMKVTDEDISNDLKWQKFLARIATRRRAFEKARATTGCQEKKTLEFWNKTSVLLEKANTVQRLSQKIPTSHDLEQIGKLLKEMYCLLKAERNRSMEAQEKREAAQTIDDIPN